jgi:hypothetical protein
MGLAVYNSIILDLHFPAICYRKLLTPPVVPPEVNILSIHTHICTFLYSIKFYEGRGKSQRYFLGKSQDFVSW